MNPFAERLNKALDSVRSIITEAEASGCKLDKDAIDHINGRLKRFCDGEHSAEYVEFMKTVDECESVCGKFISECCAINEAANVVGLPRAQREEIAGIFLGIRDSIDVFTRAINNGQAAAQIRPGNSLEPERILQHLADYRAFIAGEIGRNFPAATNPSERQ